MRLDPERVIKLDAYLPESSLLTKLRGGVGGGGEGVVGDYSLTWVIYRWVRTSCEPIYPCMDIYG